MTGRWVSAERKHKKDIKLINSKGPHHPGTNIVLRTWTLTPVVKGKTIGSKKEQREKNTFYVLYSKRNWFHRTFIFIQPFHLHRDPNLNSVILVRAASQRTPGRKFLRMRRGTAPSCGYTRGGGFICFFNRECWEDFIGSGLTLHRAKKNLLRGEARHTRFHSPPTHRLRWRHINFNVSWFGGGMLSTRHFSRSTLSM